MSSPPWIGVRRAQWTVSAPSIYWMACFSWPLAVTSRHMRELIYLSDRKLSQFRENESPRRRWRRRRVSELGAAAPFGLGELQFALTDAPQGRPTLERVLRHLESTSPKPAEYSEVSPDAGRWVKFKTRMSYQLVRPTTGDWSNDGEAIERPVGPDAVVFWEPHSRVEPWSGAKPRLVLHGSPEHLLGPTAPAEPRDLSIDRSYPPGFMDLLYGNRPHNGESPWCSTRRPAAPARWTVHAASRWPVHRLRKSHVRVGGAVLYRWAESNDAGFGCQPSVR